MNTNDNNKNRLRLSAFSMRILLWTAVCIIGLSITSAILLILHSASPQAEQLYYAAEAIFGCAFRIAAVGAVFCAVSDILIKKRNNT